MTTIKHTKMQPNKHSNKLKNLIIQLKQFRMSNVLRIKSSQRRLFILLAFTFLVGTMITIVNYNQNIVQQRFVINDKDRTALLNYFKYSHLKRNLVSDTQVTKSQQRLLPSDRSIVYNQPSSSSQINRPSINSNLPDQQSIKVSSTTFSDDKKESSTKFLINRSDRDVNRDYDLQLKSYVIQSNQNNKDKSNDVDRLINTNNNSKKPITPAPSLQQSQDKTVNLTASNAPINKQSDNSLTKQKIVLIASKPSSFVHSKAELKLTQKFIIDKKNYCSKEHGYGLDLLVMVISSPTNFDARNAIRQTWGGFAVERGSKLLFVVGHSASPDINEKLKQEDNKFEDVLQGQFQDAYYNLTLKSLAIINWVADNCEKAKYILKIDDDMFVNMQLLVDFAETREFKNVIIGKIAKKWLPHRDSNSKWYVPQSAYAGQVYPNFATGPAYLIHRDAIPNLAKVIRSNATKVIKLEDVFLAGIVAEKAGVRRLNYSLFKNAYFEVNKCNFQRFITSHQHSPKEIIRLWEMVYSDKKVDCIVKKAAVTKAPPVSNKKEQVKQSVVQIKKQPPPVPPIGKAKTESKK